MSPKDKCAEYGHEFRHLDSKHSHPSTKYVYDKTGYKRIDQFYCTRCLHIETVVRETESEKEPEWY